MKFRHKARRVAFQILYKIDLRQEPFTQPKVLIKPTVKKTQAFPLESRSRVVDDLEEHYEHFQVPEPLREFVGSLVLGTLVKKAELDQLIEETTENWKIHRMNPVDRGLIRMATYEMLFSQDVAPSIVMDESIELAKEFGSAEAPAFINGILNQIQTKQKKSAKNTE